MKQHITRRRVIGAAFIIALLVWLLWPDRQLARVRTLQRELSGPAAATLSTEERNQKRGELRAAMAKLSPAQRSQLNNDGRRRMEEELSRYMAMSPAQKTSYLDQQINREEQMRQQMSKSGKSGPGGPGGFGGPGGGGPKGGSAATPEAREQRRQQRLDNTSPESRAQWDVLRRDLAQRRQQRGLSQSPRGR